MLNVLVNPGDEELVPLTEISSMQPAIIPRPRAGRKLAVSTIYRWATRGCRDVKLEVLRAGGVTCTTRSALLRFYERVTRSGAAVISSDPAARNAISANHQRRHVQALVEKQLERAGL